MCTFNYGGQSYETLNYSVESSRPRRSYFEKPRSFRDEAKEEMENPEPEDYNHWFINVYSDSGYTFHTGKALNALKLSLVGQDYIYSPSVKKMTFISAMAVYYQPASKLLWETRRFMPENRPVFLNRERLQEILQKVFKEIDIRLGQLQEKGIRFIAWEIETEKGIFYIPWHNGCLIEQTSELEFTEMPFAELKRTYKVLRFAKCVGEREAYRIVCA